MRPRAVAVQPLDDYTLLVTFANKEKKIFDVKPYFDFIQFQELQDKDIFNKVYISGLSIEWINGQDICPDELYFDSKPTTA